MFNKKIIFISHAEKDSEVVEKFVDLLYDIGVSDKSMFCSSISEIGIPVKTDIYEYLRNLLDYDEVIPIFMLSDNYYSSAACLNEMGAVWMKQNDYFTFLLPGFEFSEIRGAINPRKRGISLGYKSEKELQNLKEDLNQFRKQICSLLNIEEHEHWERKRDEFIEQIHKLNIDSMDISLKECEGFCIGETEHDGCMVVFDKLTEKISAMIDFTKTNAEICSVVIFTGNMNMRNQYLTDKKLIFDLKASDTIFNMEVECRLKNRDVRTTVTVSSDWENYRIPLSEFNGDEAEWEDLKEIKFLFRRKNVSEGRIYVKSMMIK